MRGWFRFWTVILTLALIWIIGGIILTFVLAPGVAESTYKVIDEINKDMAKEGYGSNYLDLKPQSAYYTSFVSNGVIFFLVTGIPASLISYFLRNANRRAMIRKEEHQELVQAQQSTAAALQSIRTTSPPQPDNSRAQLEAARVLIQSKQYDAAKNLLRTIDHDKARDWLAKLDQMTK